MFPVCYARALHVRLAAANPMENTSTDLGRLCSVLEATWQREVGSLWRYPSLSDP